MTDVARSPGRGQLCPGCISLRGGVNLAPSPSLPTRALFSPHFLPLWHAGVCRSWFDISVLCQRSLLPDGCYCYQLLQGKPRTLQVTLGHYLLLYPVSRKLVTEEDSGRFWGPVFSCGFENSCSRMGCFAVLGLRVWDFFLLFTAPAHQCHSYSVTLLLAWNSPLSHFWLCKIHSNRQTLVLEQGWSSDRWNCQRAEFVETQKK